ncbi:MAG: stage II sporulation protein M [Halobacteriales archaeon]|nr:stage II sporulation protein M [Halobacteriales archaeon]
MTLDVSVVARVEPTWFVVSAFLFLAGYVASYPVTKYEVSFLTWYPLRVWRGVRKRISPDDGWLKLFVFLLTFNATSLLVNFLSGFFVVLPPVFAFLLGMNIGVISVEEAGTAGLLSLVVNPVAWLELPAAWTSLAVGTQLGLEVLNGGVSGAVSVFPELAEVYLYVVLPLLVLAAVLEATLIRLMGRREGNKEEG